MSVATSHIDDCLSRRNGHLFVEECDTVDLIEQFGSPLFVLSEDQIRRNVRRFQMSNFNAIPRPATVLVTGDRAAVVRLRETEEDVFRRDVIPNHLTR